MNLPLQNYQGGTPDRRNLSVNTSETLLFPIGFLPKKISNAIIATSLNKKVSVEIAASSFLAAASLACLPLVEVIPVHTKIPEPAGLNFLVIAGSGSGKSTVLRAVMQVFHNFSAKVNDEYKNLLSQFQVDISMWEESKKALARNLRQATSRNCGREDAEKAMEEHLNNKPPKPVRFKFLYQDISNSELIKSLGDNPDAGIFSDEAVTFFKSRAKNDPGIFNLGWDGATYFYQRDGVDYEINLRLMFCLMVQPDIFDEYIIRNQTTGRGSGFLARFLTVKVDGECKYQDGDFSRMNRALDEFDNRVQELLERAKQRFYDGIADKQKLTLSPQAIAFMGEKRAEMKQKISEGGPWEHIADIALKSGSNVLRLAAIIHYFDEQLENEISLSTIECAQRIIDWYMQQACKVFYKKSRLFLFEKDVLEVYHWIHNRMTIEGSAIIAKSDIMRLGPAHKDNNLRLASKLDPILAQLAWQKKICLVQNCTGGPVYIILPNSLGVFQSPSMRQDLFPQGCRCLEPSDVSERVELNLPNLTFSW
ncbi:YfjI family protein [Atlantibacter hermannii]|uniref:YfjI family protein n=1 Tax=Atlantibacter hermannii TaxID=565 RepID=UPI00289AB479|nr:YfjI family protein [Atlantibacter hermannii]